MSPDIYQSITDMVDENSHLIYQCDDVSRPYFETINPMMELMYERFLEELMADDHDSLIYQHYLHGSIVGNFYRHPKKRYIQTDIHDPNDIVADYIASMTDDYFVDAFSYLFPHHELTNKVKYIEYFDKRYTK